MQRAGVGRAGFHHHSLRSRAQPNAAGWLGHAGSCRGSLAGPPRRLGACGACFHTMRTKAVPSGRLLPRVLLSGHPGSHGRHEGLVAEVARRISEGGQVLTQSGRGLSRWVDAFAGSNNVALLVRSAPNLHNSLQSEHRCPSRHSRSAGQPGPNGIRCVLLGMICRRSGTGRRGSFRTVLEADAMPDHPLFPRLALHVGDKRSIVAQIFCVVRE